MSVILDPELHAAVEVARRADPARSEAAVVRSLALAGARASGDAQASSELAEVRRRFNTFPARTTDRTFPWIDEMVANEEPGTEGTDALEWVRGER